MDQTYMKEQPVLKLIVSMALPMVISMMVSSLYNIVDSFFIARISEDAMTALSLVYPVQNLINAVMIGFGIGINAVISFYLGAQDKKMADRAATQGMLLGTIHGVGFMILGIAVMRPFLQMFTGNAQIVDYGVRYSRIAFLFATALSWQLVFEKTFQAVGRMVESMTCMMSGAIINIILDPIFIFALGMGVKGAALATVLSQTVGAVWILRFLTGKKTILRLKRSNMHLDPKVFGPCLALGISTFVMLSTESLLSISFTSSLSRFGGDVAVGAMTIITSISQLVTLPLQGICQGGQPIISYNFGANKPDRVKKAFFTQFCTCVIYTTLFWLVVMIFPKAFATIFTSDKELVTYSAWALRIYMAGIFSLGFQVSCQQSFMALGQAKVSLLLACLRKIVMLIPLIFILPLFLSDKVFAVFLAEPVSDILAAAITTITFLSRFNGILNQKDLACCKIFTNTD